MSEAQAPATATASRTEGKVYAEVRNVAGEVKAVFVFYDSPSWVKRTAWKCTRGAWTNHRIRRFNKAQISARSE